MKLSQRSFICSALICLVFLVSSTFATVSAPICIAPRASLPQSDKFNLKFKDVTESAGVRGSLPQSLVRTSPACLFDQFDTTRRAWQRGSACAPEIMTGGAAAGDVDGDGREDLYVSRIDGADSLFLNMGNGTFTDASAISGVSRLTRVVRSNGVALLDIDNDGDLDIYISTLGDIRMYLLVNDGSGRFTEEAIVRGIALSREAGRPPGEGGLTASFSIAVGDYDSDGWLDLYTTEWFPRLHVPEELFSDAGIHRVTTCRLLRNLGASGKPGHFEDTTWAAGIRPRAGGAATQEEEMSEERWFSDAHQRAMLERLTRGSHKSSVLDARRRIEIANKEAREHFSQMNARAEAMHKLYRRMEQEDGGSRSVTLGGVSRKGRYPAHYFEGFPYRGIFQFGARFADLDSDGAPDLLVSGDFGTSQLYWNNGNGTFSRGLLHLFHDHFDNSMGATLGDVDGDGRLDILFTSMFLKAPARMVSDRFFPRAGIASNFEGNHLYRNDGGRLFSDVTTSAGIKDTGWAWGGVLFDYDNDGRLDFAVCNGMDDPETTDDDFAVNTPNAAFRGLPPTASPTGGATSISFAPVAAQLGLDDRRDGRGYLELDYDGDGDQDLFLVNHADFPVLYRNEGGNKNAWVRVRALESNCASDKNACAFPRSSLGAKVYVRMRSSEKEVVREVGSAAAFMAQSQLTAHFGLGVAAPLRLHSVRIEWPLWGNASRTLLNVPTRTEIVVRAPSSRGERSTAIIEGSEGAWTLRTLRSNNNSDNSPGNELSETVPLLECVFETSRFSFNKVEGNDSMFDNIISVADSFILPAPAALQPLLKYPPVPTLQEARERAEAEKRLDAVIGEWNWAAPLAEVEAQWPLDLGVPRGSASGRDTEVPDRLEWSDEATTHRVLGSTPPAPNNLERPTLGARGALFGRLLQRSAEDRFENVSMAARKGKGKVEESPSLPSARLISNRIMSFSALGLARPPVVSAAEAPASSSSTPARPVNGLFASLLGFVAHDIAGDLLPADALRRASDPGECCNIDVPASDPQWDPEATGRKEIPFRRAFYVPVPLALIPPTISIKEGTFNTTTSSSSSLPSGGLLLRSREYVNAASSFLDLHHVYGTGDAIRAGRIVHPHSSVNNAGKLVLDRTEGISNTSLQNLLLPANAAVGGSLEHFEALPNSNPRGLKPSALFVAGDVRVNELPGIVLWHTLFAREHCRLAIAMQQPTHPLSSKPQLIYSTAASQLRASYQAIVWFELLPALLGPARFSSIPMFQGYNSSVDPSVSLESAAILGVISHSMLADASPRVVLGGAVRAKLPKTPKSVALTDSWFSATSRTAPSGHGLDPLLRGLLSQRSQAADVVFVEGARNGFLGKDKGPGLDLAALDIMRGRDVGLASFGDARRALGLPLVTSFTELIEGRKRPTSSSTFNSSDELYNHTLPSAARSRLAERLEELYGRGEADVSRSDLVVAGLCEPPLPGGIVGETFAEVLADQFVRLRDGDRFWFEATDSTPSVAAALALLAPIEPRTRSIDERARETVRSFRTGEDGRTEGLLSRVTNLLNEEIEALKGEALEVPLIVSSNSNHYNVDEKSEL
jgi:hypothetical protein